MSSRTAIHLLVLVLAGVIFLLFPERQIQTTGAGRTESDAEEDEAFSELSAPTWDGVDYLAEGAEGDDANRWPGIRGQALDLRGEPVGGLTIRYRPTREKTVKNSLEGASRGASGETRRDGTFELFMSDSEEGTLSVENPSWILLGEWRTHADTWSSDVLLLVAPAITVAGAVLDGQGLPVPSAELRAAATFTLPDPVRESAGTSEWSFDAFVESDAEGRFDLGLLPALEETRIEARRPGKPASVQRLPATSTQEFRIVVRAK